MSVVKSLEHPTLKVPYEILNKRFRQAQKTIDREIARVTTATSELEKCLEGEPTVKEVTMALDGVVEQLSLLKRKASESIGEEMEAAQACKRRLDHLMDGEQCDVNSVAGNQWCKTRLDRMLVEYFLRSGYYCSAIRLAEHSGIQDLTNIDLFLISKDIEESLATKDTAKCLSWCYENKSKLRKMKSSLEFKLRQQEFVELIREGKRLEAVQHARKYFIGLEEAQMSDVQRSMGLLAFPTHTLVSPYKEMLDPARWNELVEQFRSENFKLYQLNNHSVFSVTLQAGLSALKTPHCYKDAVGNKNPDCPVCSQHLNQLAKPLPFAHCAQSRLICHVSGQPLNEHNPPMMLPNGYVYGYNTLASMAAENDGRVVCPRTKEIFNLDQAEKVFVM